MSSWGPTDYELDIDKNMLQSDKIKRLFCFDPECEDAEDGGGGKNGDENQISKESWSSPCAEKVLLRWRFGTLHVQLDYSLTQLILTTDSVFDTLLSKMTNEELRTVEELTFHPVSQLRYATFRRQDHPCQRVFPSPCTQGMQGQTHQISSGGSKSHR